MNFNPESPRIVGAPLSLAQGEPADRNLRILFAPILDLMLILLALAIVSLATDNGEREFNLTLPFSDQAEPLRRGLGEFIVNIDADGHFALNGQPIAPDELALRFERVAQEFGETGSVLIRADASTPHRHVIDVLSACRRAGLRTASFAIQPAEPVPSERKAP